MKICSISSCPVIHSVISRREFLTRSAMTVIAFSAHPLFAKATSGIPDIYLKAVRAYADCMLKYGRDTYGNMHSPLFAEGLDRSTLKLLEGEELKKAQDLKFEEWGIRSHDRMLEGANPMHSQNLYQILYALTEITGDKQYAAEAEKSLRFFLENCQSTATGLLYWGEHAGWDFIKDAPISGYVNSNIHEFFRPWVLWDRCWKLAPESCFNFARGLWEHQIADHLTGDFSRHARIEKHNPATGSPYARHGGFYIETWAFAWNKTKDPVFLKAIEIVLDYLEKMRRDGGLMVGGNINTKATFTERSVPLAVSLWEASAFLPERLAVKLREIASANDLPVLRDPRPTKDLTNIWSDGYGSAGGEIASPANLLMLRYRQSQPAGYRERILAVADEYLTNRVNLSFPVYPGTFGKVIYLMLDAHELTGDNKYIVRADELAGKALELFITGGIPLPKSSHIHEHYEGITMADTLMMSLLRLWGIHRDPGREMKLIYNDR